MGSMRGRVWLWSSVALNAFLAVLLIRAARERAAPDPQSPLPVEYPAVSNTIRTNIVIRRQHFVWSQIESDDYPTYIHNLREIGCPESTIRDIIVADINQMFARRRATELVTPQQQWWQSEPDAALVRQAADAALALDRERRNLLTSLLGPDWESADYPFPAVHSASPLDGPLLGHLTPEIKAAVHEIERDAQERLRAYFARLEETDAPPDPAEIARLRRASRDALAELLSPDQLEEYLLRYSSNAVALRDQLRGTALTPDEFRALFRALDPLDLDLELVLADPAAAAQQRRQELESQRQAILRETLGPERYESQQLRDDPLYQRARSIADQADLPPHQLAPLAAILRVTDLEIDRIRRDLTLAPEEQLEMLQATRELQRASLRRLLGEAGYQRYLESQPESRDLPPP
jgi:hypothetical protein